MKQKGKVRPAAKLRPRTDMLVFRHPMLMELAFERVWQQLNNDHEARKE